MYKVLRNDWYIFDYWALTTATHPISLITQEALNKVYSQPLAFRRTWSFWFPSVNLIAGCLSLLQSNFPFTPISSSFSCYIYIPHITVGNFKPILLLLLLLLRRTSKESITWRRRKRISLVLRKRDIMDVLDLNYSEYRWSQAAFITPLF